VEFQGRDNFSLRMKRLNTFSLPGFNICTTTTWETILLPEVA
jgi:hypothetical protein